MRALVVDDEGLLRELMRETLLAGGWDVEVAADVREARALAASAPFDVAVLDVHLGDGDGLTLCRELSARLPVVLVSGLADTATLDAGRGAGARGFLSKPFRPAELVEAVEAALAA
jgi:DNA-binding response OmpR family regulator